MEYYKSHKEEMNMNRLVHYYRQKLGRDYVDLIIKAKGKAESLKTFKVVSKLRKKINLNKNELEYYKTQLEQMEKLHTELETNITKPTTEDDIIISQKLV